VPIVESGVRVWAPSVVHWDAGAERRLSFGIENFTDRTYTIAGPDPANARVHVVARGDGTRLCGVDPRPTGAAAARPVELAPGDRVDVRVDLREACATLPAGEYRFEVEYRSPQLPDGRGTISGALGTMVGEVFVAAPATPPEGRAAPRAARSRPARP
jgi:hypothetical protein